MEVFEFFRGEFAPFIKGTKMKIINLTPHPISIVSVDGSAVTYPVGGPPARLDSRREPLGFIMDSRNDKDGGRRIVAYKVVSNYYGNHPEKGEGDMEVYLVS